MNEVLTVVEPARGEQLERLAEEVARLFDATTTVWRPDRSEAAEGRYAAEVLARAADPRIGAVVLPVQDAPGSPFWTVVRRVAKPVVALPRLATARSLRCALLPLDGRWDSSLAVAGVVPRLSRAGLRLSAVHVLGPDQVSEFCDQVAHDAEAWDEEFLRRHLPAGAALEVRRGQPAAEVLTEVERSGADLVVAGWSQSEDPGHAAVVRTILGGAVPVMLVALPSATRAGGDAEDLSLPSGDLGLSRRR